MEGLRWEQPWACVPKELGGDSYHLRVRDGVAYATSVDRIEKRKVATTGFNQLKSQRLCLPATYPTYLPLKSLLLEAHYSASRDPRGLIVPRPQTCLHR